MPDIYLVPLVFRDEGVDDFILEEHFGLDVDAPDLSGWEAITRRASRGHATSSASRWWASTSSSRTPTCRWSRRCVIRASITAARSRSIGSTPRRSPSLRSLGGCEQADGILIPGRFGGRGFEGKIRAAQIAREHRIPYLGICLGMHVAVSEFARHVAGMDGANSTEMDPETPYPVIDLLPEQKEIADMGGTMRLGADPVKLHDDTLVRELYDEPVVYERHRHRYEVNNHLRRRLEISSGWSAPGTSPDERLVEVIELESRRATRSTSPRSTTRSSSRGPSARRRCSGSSSAPRWSTPAPDRAPRPTRASPRLATRPRATSSDVRRATDAERERLHETFVALCRIESPSGHERAVR